MKAKEIKHQGIRATQVNTIGLNKPKRSDKALTLRMLKAFVTTAEICGKKIISCIQQNRWAELKAIAHANIATYYSMGLTEIADIMKYMDVHAMNKDKQRSIQKQMHRIIEKNTEVIDAVRKYINLIHIEKNTQLEIYNYEF